jgi:hypothetical protein
MRRALVAFLLVYFSVDFASPFTPGIFTFDSDDVMAIRHRSSHQTDEISVTASSTPSSSTGNQLPVVRPSVHATNQTAARETDDFVRTRRQTSSPPDSSSAPSEDH